MVARKLKQVTNKFGKDLNKPEPEEQDPDKPMLQANRADRRRAKQKKDTKGTTKVHDALRLGPNGRSRSKTGQPKWFRKMKYEQEKRKVLEGVETSLLEMAVGKVALQMEDAGYRNVWEVSQAKSLQHLVSLGMKETDLLRLRAYLEEQGLTVRWDN